MRKLIKRFEYNGNEYLFNGEDFYLFQIEDETSYNEYISEEDEKSTYMYNGEMSKIVFNISNQCNLRCQYCYAEGGSYGRSNALMTIETFDNIVAELQNNGIDKIGVLSFFGGEPLINFKLIEYAIPLMKSKFEVDNIEIVTNGTLLSETMISVLKKYNVSLSISIDGPEEVTDRLRGKGTYQRAIESIEMCKKMSYNTLCISGTYTGVHEEMGYSYEDTCSFLKEKGVRVTLSKVITDNDNLKVKRKLCRSDIREDVQKTIRDILNNNVYSTINPYVYNVFLSIFCGARSRTFCDDLLSQRSITYDYNGERYNCFRIWGEREYILGEENISAALEELNNKEEYEQCRTCWARNMCKVCVVAVKQGVMDMPFGNGECVDRMAYEIVMEELLVEIERGNHTRLADNFVDNFLVYK